MKLNTLLLSFVLTLFVSINANPVPQVQKSPIDVPLLDIDEKWKKWKDQVTFKHAPNIDFRDLDSIPYPIYDCTEAEKKVDILEQNCHNIDPNALFFRNHPWDCKITHVCLIPCANKSLFLSGALIDFKYYCSANYSNNDVCNFGTNNYNFAKCLEINNEYFGFSYSFPTISFNTKVNSELPKDLKMTLEGTVNQSIN